MISFPIIASQFWLFVAPGLYSKEKARLPAFPAPDAVPVPAGRGAGLLCRDAARAPFPARATRANSAASSRRHCPASAIISILSTRFIFGFGVAFLLPVLLMLLERAGLVTRQQLKRGRRYAIVVAFVIAAVLTPPDVVSQLLLAVPLVLLYEVSLIAIWFTERRRARDKPTRHKKKAPLESGASPADDRLPASVVDAVGRVGHRFDVLRRRRAPCCRRKAPARSVSATIDQKLLHVTSPEPQPGRRMRPGSRCGKCAPGSFGSAA